VQGGIDASNQSEPREVAPRRLTTIIDRFNTMLQSLSQEPGFQNVIYIDLRKAVSNAQADYKVQ
jgi:hypothetical protein